MFRSSRNLFFVVFVILFAAACSSEPEVDVEGTVAASLSMTQTAVPTATPIPPTETPIPTDTPTPMPTETAVPTDTPAPTDTPEPTSTPTPQPGMVETPLESGDILYEMPQSGFSFTLSPDWVALDLASADIANRIGAVGEQNESLSFLTTDYARNLIASGMQFYALNTSPGSLSSSNPFSINVIVEELPFELTVEQYATINVGQLEEIFDLAGQIEEMSVNVGDEDAVRLTYTVEIVSLIGTPIEALITQYILVYDGSAYTVTTGISADYADEYLESVRAAAETFRFLESGE